MEHNGGFIKHAHQKNVRVTLSRLRKNKFINIWLPHIFVKMNALLLNYEELFTDRIKQNGKRSRELTRCKCLLEMIFKCFYM